ncbi:DUF4031 domain-containing protein [Cupriavidus basilensis]
MTIYVDDECIPWRGKQWCHLVADSLTELHDFARRLGLRRSWFQERSVYPHYDVTVSVRDKALVLGASIGDRSTIITCAKRLKAELYAEREAVPQS